MSDDKPEPKIGAGHASAMARLGLAELRAAVVFSESNVVQPHLTAFTVRRLRARCRRSARVLREIRERSRLQRWTRADWEAKTMRLGVTRIESRQRRNMSALDRHKLSISSDIRLSNSTRSSSRRSGMRLMPMFSSSKAWRSRRPRFFRRTAIAQRRRYRALVS